MRDSIIVPKSLIGVIGGLAEAEHEHKFLQMLHCDDERYLLSKLWTHFILDVIYVDTSCNACNAQLLST